jgi:mono/diheme cytochrome c family protein
MDTFIDSRLFRFVVPFCFLTVALSTVRAQTELPQATERRVDFNLDIRPILEGRCAQCHARGKHKGGLSLETREAFLKGGNSGTVVIPGNSAESYVVKTIAGLDAEMLMPLKGTRLTRDEVALFRAWIDQDLPWPEEITLARLEPANLWARTRIAPQDQTALVYPLDQIVATYFVRQGIAWPQVVDDRTFARRVWLDSIGLLPPPEELQAFLDDDAPNKRSNLVKRLLSDNQAYTEHWLTFWNDMLRNDYKGTGYIDGGRKQISNWLYTALARNLSYDQFVTQLVHPNYESDGFTKGIVWRGVVNASMVPPMQAAQSISQVFLGVNLKCASCHDSFVNDYTLQDAYGLAAIYADGPLEIAECDKLTGDVAQAKFLYEKIGSVDGNEEKFVRTEQLAATLTAKQNGRLSRTIVNRLWQKFMGYGLVEPVDEMDRPAWSPELLDWLAEDFVDHGYDLKHTMAIIFTSRAYQLLAVNLGESIEEYVFRGPGERRMTAEQFSDAVMSLAGMDYGSADAKMHRTVALGLQTDISLPLQPKWIWSTADAAQKTQPASVIFNREVVLESEPTEAYITVSADNKYTLNVNGNAVGASRGSSVADLHDVKKYLKQGSNAISITAVNLQPNGRNPIPAELQPESDNSAGLIVYGRVRADETIMDFVSDTTWRVAAGKKTLPVFELGEADMAPWKIGQTFLATATAAKDTLPVRRASLLSADPLMIALGRPNREQVTTVRTSAATTLQALELTNGSTLAGVLKKAANELLPADSGLIERLFLKALSRQPTRTEREIADQVMGSPPTNEGVEDLLWSLAMLPEFQLIQ